MMRISKVVLFNLNLRLTYDRVFRWLARCRRVDEPQICRVSNLEVDILEELGSHCGDSAQRVNECVSLRAGVSSVAGVSTRGKL